jgi:hypothetical protein
VVFPGSWCRGRSRRSSRGFPPPFSSADRAWSVSEEASPRCVWQRRRSRGSRRKADTERDWHHQFARDLFRRLGRAYGQKAAVYARGLD